MNEHRSEAAFETVIEAHLLTNGFVPVRPANPDFEPIVLTGADAQQLQLVAELVEVLTNEA